MEGLSNIMSRIQQIETQFAPESMAPPAPTGDFQQVLQQMGGQTVPPSFQMMGAGGLPPNMAGVNPFMWNQMAGQNGITAVPAQQIASAAEQMGGKQFWPNACAHAVNEVLTNLGIDIKDKVNNNTEWVPNYANLGQKVAKMEDMKPGDLVIYNNYLGEGGYDHIGIYAGNGEAWNVSTAAGYKWVKTPIGSRFQEGHRIAS